jgi:hypothetical protein
MRRIVCLGALALLLLTGTGCFLPIYPSNPTERMDVLLVNSENYRQIQGEWKRFWFTDQPSHMTFDRIHGGIE